MTDGRRARVLVRGVNDIASAVALRLFQAGYAVMIHTEPEPTATRRGMAFADAVSDGAAVLEGVTATRVDDLAGLESLLGTHITIPVTVADLLEVLSSAQPVVLIDARLRKRAIPEVQRGLAVLTIGLGPNFAAGATTDVVIETSWEHLGCIITEGLLFAVPGRAACHRGAGARRIRLCADRRHVPDHAPDR